MCCEERERGHTRQRNSPVAKGKERRKGGGEERREAKASRQRFQLYTHAHAHRLPLQRRKRGGDSLAWWGEKEDDSTYVETGWNVYVIRASCIISRLRVSLSTLCHATVVYVLSRRNFSRVCRPLARDSLYPICRILIYSWNVFGYRSIFRKGEIRRIRFV